MIREIVNIGWYLWYANSFCFVKCAHIRNKILNFLYLVLFIYLFRNLKNLNSILNFNINFFFIDYTFFQFFSEIYLYRINIGLNSILYIDAFFLQFCTPVYSQVEDRKKLSLHKDIYIYISEKLRNRNKTYIQRIW